MIYVYNGYDVALATGAPARPVSPPLEPTTIGNIVVVFGETAADDIILSNSPISGNTEVKAIALYDRREVQRLSGDAVVATMDAMSRLSA